MAWVRVESSVARNRKFIQAGPAASWLWLCGLAYCQEGLTDGFIPIEALPVLGVIGHGKADPRRLATSLVLTRLWEVADGGWRVHDYFDHNKDAETVRRIQHARREGGKLGGRPNLQGKPSEAEKGNLTENPSTALLGSATATDQKKKESSEPSNGSAPPVLEFPTVGELSTWGLSDAQVVEWEGLFPNLDVLSEARRALAWIQATPAKRKTGKGMARFLVNWLNRAVDQGGRAQPRESRGAAPAPVHEPWTCPHVEEHASRWRCDQATALNRPRKAEAS